jgi:PPOX class probable F420-dependent enzyme
MDQEEALARVRGARVGRLATITPEGRPHVVPFVFELVVAKGASPGEPTATAYWAVDEKPKRKREIQRLRNIEQQPAVEFVVDDYTEDWAGLWWVRCSGTARIVHDVEERRAALEALAAKYPHYEANPPKGPVVAIDTDRITGWTGSSA